MNAAPKAPATTRASEVRRRPEAIRIDDVGEAAIDMAARVDMRVKPRARDLEGLPSSALSAKEAYVVTLLDGKTSMDSLVAIAPMSREELEAVVDRLRRMGLIGDR